MAEKTYYEILGVDKTADADTIKKAYRKLVRKYHPDVSKEPDAAERTAEINTAYETLSDREKRAEYDELLANPYGRSAGGFPFGGANGDLYLKIKFHDKPDLYVKNKKDVYQTIDVKPWEAVLGGKIIVPTAAGRLQVNLPANSQNGKSIRLKGKGIPAKEAGDLYLNIRISVPKAESEADRAAWAQLAAHFDGKSASN